MRSYMFEIDNVDYTLTYPSKFVSAYTHALTSMRRSLYNQIFKVLLKHVHPLENKSKWIIEYTKDFEGIQHNVAVNHLSLSFGSCTFQYKLKKVAPGEGVISRKDFETFKALTFKDLRHLDPLAPWARFLDMVEETVHMYTSSLATFDTLFNHIKELQLIPPATLNWEVGTPIATSMYDNLVMQYVINKLTPSYSWGGLGLQNQATNAKKLIGLKRPKYSPEIEVCMHMYQLSDAWVEPKVKELVEKYKQSEKLYESLSKAIYDIRELTHSQTKLLSELAKLVPKESTNGTRKASSKSTSE